MQARTMIATPETDTAIRDREFKAGLKARVSGLERTACPWQDHNSLAASWWFEGFDALGDK